MNQRYRPGLALLLFVLTAVAGGCDSDDKKAQTKPPATYVWREEAEDHVRLYEYKLGPNGERIFHGKFLIFGKNNEKLGEGYYLDGKESGILRAWHRNGKAALEGEYVFGEKNGEWIYWDESGNVTKRERWVGGRLLIPEGQEAPTSQPTSAPATSQPILVPAPASQPALEAPTFGR